MLTKTILHPIDNLSIGSYKAHEDYFKLLRYTLATFIVDSCEYAAINPTNIFIDYQFVTELQKEPEPTEYIQLRDNTQVRSFSLKETIHETVETLRQHRFKHPGAIMSYRLSMVCGTTVCICCDIFKE